jgi:hypothetical protein
MIDKKEVLRFAKKYGYSDVKEHEQSWNGYDIWEPFFGDKEKLCVSGPPRVILVKGGKIRMSTCEEGTAAILFLYPASEEEIG